MTAELDDAVSVIDPKTLQVVGSVPTGKPESHMLAITRDGKRGYTANVGSGTVSALDLEKRTTLAVIPVSKVVQRISLSVDDRLAFTSDQTEPRLVAISTATNTIERTLKLPAPGYGTATTEDGRWLVVPMPKANQVAVVDLREWSVAHVIDVPKAPQEALVRPDGKIAYVSCDAQRPGRGDPHLGLESGGADHRGQVRGRPRVGRGRLRSLTRRLLRAPLGAEQSVVARRRSTGRSR